MIDMRNPNFSNHDNESGFILPTVLVVLVIVTILAVTAVTVAVKSSSSTTRDSNVKSALAAAEGGLQLATYRINSLKPETNECVITSVKEGVVSSEKKKVTESETCATETESLGNGASFKYYNTSALTKGECAGTAIVPVTNIQLRCITAEGIVNGVSPHTRVQALIESAVGEALFKIKGIVGLEEVLVTGSVKATSVVASNKLITNSGKKQSGTFEKGFEICPGGVFTPAAGAERTKSGVHVGPQSPGKEPQEDPELEITRTSGCPLEEKIPAVHPTAAENEDSRIANGTDPNTGEAKNLKYTESSHTLEMGANVKLTLGGSKYYFCKLLGNSNGELLIAKGAKIEIFIGDQAEGCPAGSGTFTVEGNSHIENPNGANALLIEMAGKGPLTITNSGSMKANIFAPEAEVILSGAGKLTGSIVGKKTHLEGGAFLVNEEEPLTVGGSGKSTNTRKAWTQCSSGTGVASAC
jgi:type II secretory pathway pseudopilin PulG